MKKILFILFAVFCVMMIASCDTTNNPGNNTQDPSLDGIDISKFEMPQTEFMHDGHELSKLEEVFKLVIEKGTFVYDKNLNSIGYKLELEKEASTTLYAYYSVSELRIIYLEMQGKVAHSTYFKLDDQGDTFAMCHKIQYFSGRRQDFLGIMNYNRIDFDGVKLGEYELYRGYNTQSEAIINNKILTQGIKLVTLFNEKTTSEINISLSEFGFNV